MMTIFSTFTIDRKSHLIFQSEGIFMNKIKRLLIASLVVLTASCASNKASVNFDQNTDINTADYKTFAWMTDSKITVATDDINPVMKVRVDSAIEQAFIGRGYQLIDDAKKSDFTISYTVGSREKVRVDRRPVSYQFGWGHGRYSGRHYYDTENTVRHYTEGKLAIDIADVKTNQPVFHGWATKRLSAEATESDLPEINNIVLQIVNQFQ